MSRMAGLTVAQVDAQILIALKEKEKRISVDGLDVTKKSQSVTDLLKIRADCVAAESTANRTRPIRYQKFISQTNGGQ